MLHGKTGFYLSWTNNGTIGNELEKMNLVMGSLHWELGEL